MTQDKHPDDEQLSFLKRQWDILREQLYKDNADFKKLFAACDWVISNLKFAAKKNAMDWVLLIQAVHYMSFRKVIPDDEVDPLLYSLYLEAFRYNVKIDDFLKAYQELREKNAFIISAGAMQTNRGSRQSLLEVLASRWYQFNLPFDTILSVIKVQCSAIEASSRSVVLERVTMIVAEAWITQENGSRVLEVIKELQRLGARIDKVVEGRKNLFNVLVLIWRLKKVPLCVMQETIRYLMDQGVDPKSKGDLLSSPIHIICEFFLQKYRFYDVRETLRCFFPESKDPHQLLTLRDNRGQTPLLVLVQRCVENNVSLELVIEMVKDMVTWGADLNATDNSGCTVFHAFLRGGAQRFRQAKETSELLHYLFVNYFTLSDPVEQAYFLGIHQLIACGAPAPALTKFKEVFEALEKKTEMQIKQYQWILDSVIAVLGVAALEGSVRGAQSDQVLFIPRYILLKHYSQDTQTLDRALDCYESAVKAKVDHPFRTESLEFAEQNFVTLATPNNPRVLLLSAKLLRKKNDWEAATRCYCQLIESDIQLLVRMPKDDQTLSRIREVVGYLVQIAKNATPSLIIDILVQLLRAEHIHVSEFDELLEAYHLEAFFSETPFDSPSDQSFSFFVSTPQFSLTAAKYYQYLIQLDEDRFTEMLERHGEGQLNEGEDKLIEFAKSFNQALGQTNSTFPQAFFLRDTLFVNRIRLLVGAALIKDKKADKGNGSEGYEYSY